MYYFYDPKKLTLADKETCENWLDKIKADIQDRENLRIGFYAGLQAAQLRVNSDSAEGCRCTCFDSTNVTGAKCPCHPHAPSA